MRDELLNREQIDALREARVLLEQWRHHRNTRRPHSSLGYRPPAPETRVLTITPLDVAEARQLVVQRCGAGQSVFESI